MKFGFGCAGGRSETTLRVFSELLKTAKTTPPGRTGLCKNPAQVSKTSNLT